MGSKSFVNRIKGSYYDLKAGEIPQAKTFAPASKMIIDAVCAFYDVKPDDLKKTQRGIFNEPRNAAVYLMRKIRRNRLKEVGKLPKSHSMPKTAWINKPKIEELESNLFNSVSHFH